MDKSSSSIRKLYQRQLTEWYCMMVGCCAAMPKEELEELKKWEEKYLNGETVGTSGWPGWAKYIGPRPVPPELSFPAKKSPIPIRIRIAVWRRDGFSCRHCGSENNLTIDHIFPESKGGPAALDNLQTLCKSCNSRKGNR